MSASLNAARIRSWSVSTSSGSTASFEMRMSFMSCVPVRTMTTAPPPAVPSTVASASSAWAFAMLACISFAMRARSPMFFITRSP